MTLFLKSSICFFSFSFFAPCLELQQVPHLPARLRRALRLGDFPVALDILQLGDARLLRPEGGPDLQLRLGRLPLLLRLFHLRRGASRCCSSAALRRL